MANKLEVSVGINNAGFRQGLDQMRDGARKFKGELSNMFVGVAGPVALATGAVLTLKRAFDKASEMEGFQVAFKTILGSMELAKQRMKELSDFAAATPFDLPEIAKASKTLQTLTDGALATGDGLRLVGDAAATAQVPFGELAVTIGRVYAGAMAGSKTIGAEINRLVELGLVSITTKNRLTEMMEQGKKGGEVWGIVARDLERFKGQMEAMSDTLAGRMSTLGDAWDEILRKFAQPLLPNAKDATAQLTSVAGAAEILATWLSLSIKGLVAYVAGGIDLIANAAKSTIVLLGGFKDAVGKILTGDLKGAGDAIVQADQRATAGMVESWDRWGKRFQVEKDSPSKSGESPEAAIPDDGAIEADKALQKREDRLQKIRDNEEEARRDALDGEARINALIEERDRLIKDFHENADEDAGVESLEKAQKIQREIEAEEREMAKEKERQAKEEADKKKKAAEDETRRQEGIADARKDEAEAKEDDGISQLEGEKKIAALQAKRDRMQKEADALETTDPEAAARKRTEIIGVDAQIRSEKDTLAEEQKSAQEKALEDAEKARQAAVDERERRVASISVDSLQAVGGGRGNISGSADPMLRANEQQLQELREIKQLLGATEARNSIRVADPWR